MNGSIRPVTLERIVDRTDASLPAAWLGHGQKARPWSSGKWLTRELPEIDLASPGPILIMLRAGESGASSWLTKHATSGARVYVLIDGSASDDHLRALQAPNFLVRRVPEVPASSLHTATGARIWIGGGYSLALAGAQPDALRQTFLRLFWHQAMEEASVVGWQFKWRPAGERPFDVPELPGSASVRLEPPDARLGVELRGAQVHLAAGVPSEGAPRRLWFPAGGEHHERLERLARTGAEIVWEDRGLPDMALDADAGEVLLPGLKGRLRVRLTKPQASELARLLEGEAAWRFGTELRIGAAELRDASIWLAGEPKPRGLDTEQVIALPAVQATSVRGVHTTEPGPLPAPQPLALSARYRWTVEPPRVPGGSAEDPLVGRWRSLDTAWQERISAARSALERSDGERSRIAGAFERLVSAVLGFKRKHKDLISEVEELGRLRPSDQGPEPTPALLERLDRLEAAVRSHQGELEDAERKAREDDEREKQQRDWEAQVERAKGDAARLQEEVEREVNRQAALANEAGEIDARSKDSSADAKDLEVQRKRNTDDRKDTEKRLKKLRYDLDKAKREAETSFTFDAKNLETKARQTQGKRFVPTASVSSPALQVPRDALPKVGELRSHKGQRYLVIKMWEQLDDGEKAAARLSAKLVAREDT